MQLPILTIIWSQFPKSTSSRGNDVWAFIEEKRTLITPKGERLPILGVNAFKIVTKTVNFLKNREPISSKGVVAWKILTNIIVALAFCVTKYRGYAAE